MYAIARILVPVDFSPCSRAALDYAAFLGERFGAAIDVLHVWATYPVAWDPPSLIAAGYTPLVDFERSDAGRQMKAFLGHLEHRIRSPVRGRLDRGAPVDRILAAAAEGYDLVVMGTHGRTGVAHLLFGSVAEAVVRRAPCPVVTIHDLSHPTRPTAAAPEDDRADQPHP
jgi:nucleotide-binding universal stress UspA family protein